MNNKFTLILTLQLIAFFVLAQPGSLDSTFGNSGKLQFNLAKSSDQLNDVAVQSDGKILALGERYSGYLSGYAACLVRYNADGSPDTSFGDAGILVLEELTEAYDISVRPDGKILIAGYWDNADFFFRVLRLLPDGTSDSSFGSDGKVDLASLSGPVAKLASVLPDGRIAVAMGYLDWSVVILLPDGSLDGSFGNSGISTFTINGNTLYDIAVLPNGKMLVTGNDATGKVALVRLNPDGTLDADFGNGGVVVAGSGVGQSIAVQPDNKILVGGYRNTIDKTYLKVFRYLPDGTEDPDFQPQQFITNGGLQQAGNFNNDLLLLPNGKIILSGFEENNDQSDMALLCFLPDGSLDPNFGNSGLALANLSPSIERGTALALLPNGNVLLGGSSNYDFSLAAFDVDGNLDANFNGGRLNLGEGDDFGTQTVVQPDGKILIGGQNNAHLGGSFMLARLLSNGSIDVTFSEDGQIAQGDETVLTEMNDMQLLSDGKILVCGNADLKIQVTRFLSDGTTDTSFGENGLSEFQFMEGNFDNSFGEAMAVHHDGKILVGGYLASIPYKFALARLLPDGSMDVTFGDNGQVITAFSNDGSQINALAVQPDGKIIAGGYDGFIGNDQFALARYLPDGSLDSNFGNGGTLTLLDGTRCYVRSLAIQPDGDILVFGSGRDDNSQLTAKLLRLLPDGTPDPGFGDAGWINTIYGGIDNSYGTDMALQPDGKILICGDASGSDFSLFAMARYLSDGTPDSSFGNQGIVLDDILLQYSSAETMTIHDGKVVLFGVTAEAGIGNDSYSDLAIARYLLDLDVGTLDFLSGANEVLIYPNPVGEVATLKFETIGEVELSISLIDTKGRVVKRFSKGKIYQPGQNSELLYFDWGLPTGNYFLRMSDGQNAVSVQIFKK